MKRAVYIEWHDPYSIDEWSDLEEIEMNRSLVKSVGFILKESETHYLFSSTYDEGEDRTCCVIVLPKRVIETIKPVGFVDDKERSIQIKHGPSLVPSSVPD